MNRERWYYRAGLSAEAERVFERMSTTFVITLATAWAFAITNERVVGDKLNLVTPATAAVANALSDQEAPTAAYVTDAITNTVAENTAATAGAVTEPDSVLGQSGRLRASISSGTQPGIVSAVIAVGDALKRIADFNLITLRPASDKQRGRIGLYFIGNWPAASKGKGGLVDYTPPSGFIEVTKSNQNTQLSDHFRLRDFLTHDQQSVWPKYLVVNLKLVDKLELVLQDLKERGIDPSGVHVMSGFRTPQYNVGGGDPR
jgi:hypothetical protein